MGKSVQKLSLLFLGIPVMLYVLYAAWWLNREDLEDQVFFAIYGDPPMFLPSGLFLVSFTCCDWRSRQLVDAVGFPHLLAKPPASIVNTPNETRLSRTAVLVDAMITAGGDLNMHDDSGMTALQWAMRARDTTVIPLILSRGGNACGRSVREITPSEDRHCAFLYLEHLEGGLPEWDWNDVRAALGEKPRNTRNNVYRRREVQP